MNPQPTFKLGQILKLPFGQQSLPIIALRASGWAAFNISTSSEGVPMLKWYSFEELKRVNAKQLLENSDFPAVVLTTPPIITQTGIKYLFTEEEGADLDIVPEDDTECAVEPAQEPSPRIQFFDEFLTNHGARLSPSSMAFVQWAKACVDSLETQVKFAQFNHETVMAQLVDTATEFEIYRERDQVVHEWKLEHGYIGIPDREIVESLRLKVHKMAGYADEQRQRAERTEQALSSLSSVLPQVQP